MKYDFIDHTKDLNTVLMLKPLIALALELSFSMGTCTTMVMLSYINVLTMAL